MYLVAHACYKGALFLVAGAIDHETGTRDITRLAGLRRAMPITAVAGGAAALSMAGVPLTLGFVGKDAAYEALLQAAAWSAWLLTSRSLASILLGLAGLLAGVLPFRGTPAGRDAHEPPWPLWLPPLALALVGVVAGVAPWVLNAPLSAAAAAILNAPGGDVAGGLARTFAGVDAQRADAAAASPPPTRCAMPCDDARGASGSRHRGTLHRRPLRAGRDQPRHRSAAAQRIAAVVRDGDCRDHDASPAGRRS